MCPWLKAKSFKWIPASLIILVSSTLLSGVSFGQTDSTSTEQKVSKFDEFNKKAERLFRVVPVPMASYSTEAGHVFGLAKFNMIRIYKADSLTLPSKVSAVFTVSTKGRYNFSLADEIVLRNNEYIFQSYINYKETPEYIFGIGNNVKREDVERINTERIKVFVSGLYAVRKYFYAGALIDVSKYYNVSYDSGSYLEVHNVKGKDGGTNSGLGLLAAFDNRDNRYNASRGGYTMFSVTRFDKLFGSRYSYFRFDADFRKYHTTWRNQIFALQLTTSYTDADVPFYELPMMGGDASMRGYYKGAYRDKTLLDFQAEYRVPVWNIFGFATWLGFGQVSDSYQTMSLNGFRPSYGIGLRVRVDSRTNTNLRLDFGLGSSGVRGTYISFAEAF